MLSAAAEQKVILILKYLYFINVGGRAFANTNEVKNH